ncbi:hypothetical protein C8R44DRAFT_645917 [Mycena epipterygia]|nr:hypothetical protein C8R44DRAFT_645917 [Mycena epipterygia]
MNNVSFRNGPDPDLSSTWSKDSLVSLTLPYLSKFDTCISSRDTVHWVMFNLDLDGAKARFPGCRHQPKQCGHLTDTRVFYELHFDGHEKLNFKALQMGPVGIDIYGARCHSSSKMVKFLVVPNGCCSSMVGHYYLDLVEQYGGAVSTRIFFLVLTRDSVFVQATVDGGSEPGELYAVHVALRQQCMPYITIEDQPAFVALKSTDNIPIESSWNLFTNYVGLDIKQIILHRKSLNYFHPISSDLFNWLWPKIMQLSLNEFVEYWNNHRIRAQHNKLLPSGFSPNYICDFPESFGLVDFSVPAPQNFIDTLRQNIPKPRGECYRWVSDEFDVGSERAPKLVDPPRIGGETGEMASRS